MLKICRFFPVVFMLLLTMSSFALAAGGDEGLKNYVEVNNRASMHIQVTFVCYTEHAHASGKCFKMNTWTSISPGHSKKWEYDYEKGMGCQNIYLHVKGYAKGCSTLNNCNKQRQVSFAENEAKRFKIEPYSGDRVGILIKPIHGTFIN